MAGEGQGSEIVACCGAWRTVHQHRQGLVSDEATVIDADNQQFFLSLGAGPLRGSRSRSETVRGGVRDAAFTIDAARMMTGDIRARTLSAFSSRWTMF